MVNAAALLQTIQYRDDAVDDADDDADNADDADGVEESEHVLAERRHMAAVVNMICCNLWSNL